ncbi:MAG TPA: ABC transporter substrate-binding protein, partial [Gaiellaceae bacterium]
MKKRFVLWLAAAGVAATLAVGLGSATAATHSAKATNITLQLKWVPQAQFAGYYAAVKQGFYTKEGLNVTLKNGGPDIIPEQVVASGQAQFGVDWLPSLLAARDKGTDLVNVAQVFARSGMTQLTWKTSGITSIADMKGKKVANWLGGNQYELFAALVKNGMNPDKNQGVTIVQQPFDMNLFLDHKVDSASAMTYNELAQVLESKDPKTGKLFTLSDLNVLKMQNVGTGMLEDGLFSTSSWLSGSTNGLANTTIAVRFIKASLEGWIYCRDHLASCVDITLQYGPTLPKGHQTWQMNELNRLIWPNTSGIGVMNAADYARTA